MSQTDIREILSAMNKIIKGDKDVVVLREDGERSSTAGKTKGTQSKQTIQTVENISTTKIPVVENIVTTKTQPPSRDAGFSTNTQSSSSGSRGNGFGQEFKQPETTPQKADSSQLQFSGSRGSGFSSSSRGGGFSDSSRGGGFSSSSRGGGFSDSSRGGGFSSSSRGSGFSDSSRGSGFSSSSRGGGFSSSSRGGGFSDNPRGGGFSSTSAPSLSSRAVDTALGNLQTSAANLTEAARIFYEMGQPGRTAREGEQRREIENNLARAQRDLERLQQDNAPLSDLLSQKNIIDHWQRQLDAFSTTLDGQVQQKAANAASRLSDQTYEQGQQRLAKAHRDLDPFEAGFLGLEESAVRAAQRGLANALLPGGSAVWQTVQNFGTGVRESRQAGGDLADQLWGGVGRAFPVAEKYGAVLGDTGAKSEELTPFLRGFLDEELKRSEPTGEKDAFSLGFEWEEPKTTKPSEEVEKDPFLIGFGGEDSSEVSANYYSEPETEDKKEVDPYSNIHYHEDGTVVVTDDWTERIHPHLDLQYKPYAVIDTLSQSGRQKDRTFYDAQGRKILQISNGPHSNSKWHQYGTHGEHAHDIIWNGTEIVDRTTRELTDTERKENSDIL